MKPLAIIPARAGSKRLPGKNQMEVGGMTLVERAITVADESRVINSILLTSDDPRVWQARVPFTLWHLERPAELATDSTPMMDVVRHAVGKAKEWDISFDVVVLLQPTSPLRTANDVRQALVAMEATRADALVSVVETRNPEVYTIGHADRLRPVQRLVDGRRLVVPNGAIFAIRTAVLDQGLDWWTAQSVYGYEMPPERSVDIDTAEDLDRARQLWTAQN